MTERFRARLGAVSLTLLLLVLAAVSAQFLWRHYVEQIWTRDARVRAVVINVAPDVSGELTAMKVGDNEAVKMGQLLFEVDPERYRLAVEQAQAEVLKQQQELELKESEAKRRQRLGQTVISSEEREQARSAAAGARAALQVASAQLAIARLNLARAQVTAPMAGVVTHLQSHTGDYAITGKPVVTLVATDSFWVEAYVKETQVHRIAVGDPAWIYLLGEGSRLNGHVRGIGRGIANSNNDSGEQGLPAVAPTFDWVRLAQRIPVRIELDHPPANLLLSAGMTANVRILPASGRKD